MARLKSQYVCQECGHSTSRWFGRCPACQAWNTLVEEALPEPKRRSGQAFMAQGGTKPQRLPQVEAVESQRLDTGIGELNRVLGGGIVPGSLVLVGGDPGIGKSTLLLQVAANLAKSGREVMYISGEESPQQVRLRAQRLGALEDNVLVLATTEIEAATGALAQSKASLAIVDSIQAMGSADITSAPGSVGQVRECTGQLLQVAKQQGLPIILVGHMTKGGALAGPKVLEHAVDAVLYFEGDSSANYRILRAVKNRFGSTNEIGVFDMSARGLTEITNPSEMFLAERLEQSPGSIVIGSIEGSRPLLLEIQALVSATAFGGVPRRQTTGVDYNRVAMILAVLEKRMGYPLQTHDVFVNVAGGVKVTEPAADLGVALAVASSLQNVAIKPGTVALGEIGLGGEIRGVPQIEQRLGEAAKLGFQQCLVPTTAVKNINVDGFGIEVVPVRRIEEALRAVGCSTRR